MGRAGWGSLWTRPAQTRSGRPLPLTATPSDRHREAAARIPRQFDARTEINNAPLKHVGVPKQRNQCLPEPLDGPVIAIGVTQRTKRFWMMQLLMHEEVSHRCINCSPAELYP